MDLIICFFSLSLFEEYYNHRYVVLGAESERLFDEAAADLLSGRGAQVLGGNEVDHALVRHHIPEPVARENEEIIVRTWEIY